jgi:hypothetical protein
MKINSIQHVRNGSDESFTQVLFSDGRNFKNMMAIAFESLDDRLAIINLDAPTTKYAAADFRDQLRQAIATWEDSWNSDKGIYMILFPFMVR